LPLGDGNASIVRIIRRFFFQKYLPHVWANGVSDFAEARSSSSTTKTKEAFNAGLETESNVFASR
jgi:hypothetical protein